MTRLTEQQLQEKVQFIHDYIEAENAATGSKFDANANVDSKNIATLEAELWKDFNIQLNRKILTEKIKELFDKETADEYIRQLNSHELYKHDETSLKPYCVSVSMYPLLIDGMTKMGGESKAPKHLYSFNGVFINFVFATAAQFAGAVATVEWLMYFDYFARKDFGDNYLETHEREIKEALQHVVYSLNQPAAARGYQSVFWNISIYDKYYFDAMFGNFVFPDMSRPKWETVDKLQRYFMRWFNQERTKSILTYPVVTAAVLTENGKLKDEDYEDFLAEEMSKGNSFFIFMSDSPHALSSCCRLKNDIEDQINEFSYSLGAGGVMTGSVGVMTLNLNRLVQDAIKKYNIKNPKENYNKILEYLKENIQKVHKYQYAYRKVVEWYYKNKMLPVYDAGFITLDKQFSTVGINGLVEASEFMGFEISPNEKYMKWVSDVLKTFSDENKEGKKKYGIKFNTEFVPAENLAAKNYKWDKEDGYWVPEWRNLYSSYIYAPEDDKLSVLDRLELHGKETSKYLDGGQAAHLNLEDYPSKESYRKLLRVAATVGCDYWTYNVRITICNDCGHIDKRTHYKCPKCGSKNIDHATRVIGYLKRVSAFSKARQQEEKLRFYERIK